jgi:hypothetical protein
MPLMRLFLALTIVTMGGCKVGCLTGNDDSCIVPSPCEDHDIYDGRRAGFDLAATVPFVGRERALVTLDFRAAVRLGALSPRVLPAAGADQ